MQDKNISDIRTNLMRENDLLFLSKVERYMGASIASFDRAAFVASLIGAVRAQAATGLAGPVLRPPVFFDAFVNALGGMPVVAAARKAVDGASFIAHLPGTPRSLYAEAWAWAHARLEAADDEELKIFAESRTSFARWPEDSSAPGESVSRSRAA